MTNSGPHFVGSTFGMKSWTVKAIKGLQKSTAPGRSIGESNANVYFTW